MRSSISVIPNCSIVSIDITLADLGVSRSVLSNPNIDSIGPVGIIPMSSSTVSSATKVSNSATSSSSAQLPGGAKSAAIASTHILLYRTYSTGLSLSLFLLWLAIFIPLILSQKNLDRFSKSSFRKPYLRFQYRLIQIPRATDRSLAQ